jgi:DNA-binding response OmpR family regulator
VSKYTDKEKLLNAFDSVIHFLETNNLILTKEIIENIVFKENVDENTLRNMVYRLRKKLDTEVIITIKDLGYLIRI